MGEKRIPEKSLALEREVMDSLQEISGLLNTGLDSETLSIVVRLCELGVNPEALASVIRELRREMASYKAAEET